LNGLKGLTTMKELKQLIKHLKQAENAYQANITRKGDEVTNCSVITTVACTWDCIDCIYNTHPEYTNKARTDFINKLKILNINED
jgi:hypothetical protein